MYFEGFRVSRSVQLIRSFLVVLLDFSLSSAFSQNHCVASVEIISNYVKLFLIQDGQVYSHMFSFFFYVAVQEPRIEEGCSVNRVLERMVSYSSLHVIRSLINKTGMD